MERLKDLLNPNNAKKLILREDKKFETYIENLSTIECRSSRELLEYIEQALEYRKINKTNMNE